MEKIDAIDVAFENAKIRARKDLLSFTLFTMPEMETSRFHTSFYNQLQKFATGEVRKMMVWVPPQHGKSEAATRRMSAFLLGVNPDTKIAIVSYNSPMARKFNRDIQRIIDTVEYSELFPKTTLNAKNVATVSGSYLRNADECEIINRKGGFKTVGVGGALTGTRVDVLIIDDVYKDAADAWSSTVRENINDWYDTVATTRLHNDSRQLVVFTRWHEDDLAGRILKNTEGWTVVKYEAIKTGEPTDIDPRQPGEPLWPERHNVAGLLAQKKNNPYAFESLYQQNPSPKGGNHIKGEWFNIVDSLPQNVIWDIWVDGAYTKSTKNDPSGIMIAGKDIANNRLYVLTFIEAYMELPELIDSIIMQFDIHALDRRTQTFVEPKASGKSLVQMLRTRRMNAAEIESKLISQGKEARMHTAVPSVQGGSVYLLRGAWNKAFIHQLEAFPGAKHDEAVDLLGYAVEHYFLTPTYKTIVQKSNVPKY